MPHTERARRKAAAESKARRALIDPDTPRPPQGEIPWPTEAEMLERLERAQERRWGATAARVVHLPRVVGRGNGNVRPGKDEY